MTSTAAHAGVDLMAALGALSQTRPIFHSEADLQHALAWPLQRLAPTFDIRLERRPDPAVRQAADVVDHGLRR